MELKRGLVHLYTGSGKGKTTAALGLCLRALGWGLKCCFIQFIKGKETGELFSIGELPNFEFYQTGRPDYDFHPTEEDRERAKRGLLLAREKAKEVDLLVLDEINVAVHLGLIPLEEVIDFVKKKPLSLELVLTGRHAKKELIELSDYATYFQLLKHPFYRGIPARKGIDY